MLGPASDGYGSVLAVRSDDLDLQEAGVAIFISQGFVNIGLREKRGIEKLLHVLNERLSTSDRRRIRLTRIGDEMDGFGWFWLWIRVKELDPGLSRRIAMIVVEHL